MTSTTDTDALCWQPITTAPKEDRTVILLAVPKGKRWTIKTGWWSADRDGRGCWVLGGSVLRPMFFQPTHWMPLPAPPSPEGVS